jgi:hypothetical protein
MAERSFAPATGQPYKPQNFYMRLVIANLNRVKVAANQNAEYCFAIYKGKLAGTKVLNSSTKPGKFLFPPMLLERYLSTKFHSTS